jgi:hypothetical protein
VGFEANSTETPSYVPNEKRKNGFFRPFNGGFEAKVTEVQAMFQTKKE